MDIPSFGRIEIIPWKLPFVILLIEMIVTNLASAGQNREFQHD
jgi:hypothetical protein